MKRVDSFSQSYPRVSMTQSQGKASNCNAAQRNAAHRTAMKRVDSFLTRVIGESQGSKVPQCMALHRKETQSNVAQRTAMKRGDCFLTRAISELHGSSAEHGNARHGTARQRSAKHRNAYSLFSEGVVRVARLNRKASYRIEVHRNAWQRKASQRGQSIRKSGLSESQGSSARHRKAMQCIASQGSAMKRVNSLGNRAVGESQGSNWQGILRAFY